MEARGTAFSDDEYEDAGDLRTFAYQRSILPHNFASTLIAPSGIPAWMSALDSGVVETTAQSNEDADTPKRPGGEEFIRLLYARPTHPLPRQAIFRRLKALICLHTGRDLPESTPRAREKTQWRRLPLGGTLVSPLVKQTEF